MKSYLHSLVQTAPSPLQARNLAREYLQALILNSLQRAGAMVSLAFHGGTALRFLFDLPRYSEDLDFALERAPERYDFQSYLRAIRRDLEAQVYVVTFKVNDRKTVHSAFVRFPGLLFEMGLSSHRDEVLAVKIEVDTHPPAGAGLTTTLIRRHVLLHLQHHDKASLLAGKLHAILQRSYLKGRDVYDLLWYLSAPDWPPPNLEWLNNALAQTGWTDMPLTPETWRAAVRERLAGANWKQILADVQPFISDPQEAALLNRENLTRLLET